MNILDIVIVLILGYNAIKGFQKGFVRISFDLVGFFGGLFVAWQFKGSAMALIEPYVQLSPLILQSVAFFMVWLSVIFASRLMCKIVQRVITITFLGPINILAGFGLGIGKGLCFVLPIVIALMSFQIKLLDDSIIASRFKPLAQWVMTDMWQQWNIQIEGLPEKILFEMPKVRASRFFS